MFLADESVDFGLVTLLRASGFSVNSISEEHSGIPDTEVLKIAVGSNLILITEDKDLGELSYRLRLPHCGILLLRLTQLPRKSRLDLAHTCIKHYHDQMKDAFCVLNELGLRIK